MQTIVIKPFHHRGKEVMGLYYSHDASLSNAVKRVKDIRWSRTHTCWYLPCSRPYYTDLCNATCGLAEIDRRQLKAYLDQKQGFVTDVTTPIHKATAALIKEYPLNEQNLQALIAYRNLLTVKKYSAKTINNYSNAFHQLLRMLGSHFIGDFDRDRVQSYLLWLVEKRSLPRWIKKNCSCITTFTYY